MGRREAGRDPELSAGGGRCWATGHPIGFHAGRGGGGGERGESTTISLCGQGESCADAPCSHVRFEWVWFYLGADVRGLITRATSNHVGLERGRGAMIPTRPQPEFPHPAFKTPVFALHTREDP